MVCSTVANTSTARILAVVTPTTMANSTATKTSMATANVNAMNTNLDRSSVGHEVTAALGKATADLAVVVKAATTVNGAATVDAVAAARAVGTKVNGALMAVHRPTSLAKVNPATAQTSAADQISAVKDLIGVAMEVLDSAAVPKALPNSKFTFRS